MDRGAWIAGCVAAAVAASGCGYLGSFVGARTRVDEFERAAEVTVDTAPAGAAVSVGGTDVGDAPATYTARYRVRRSYRQRRYRWTWIGCAVDLTVTVYAFSKVFDLPTEWQQPAGYVAMWPAIMGCVAAPIQTAMRNQEAAKFPVERVLPGEVAIEARWPGWPASETVLAIDGPRRVVVRRPSLGTFDEALIQWARVPGRRFDPESRYRVGWAFHRLYDRTGRPDDARAAVEQWEAYLADGSISDERRAEVAAAVEALRRRMEPRP